MNTKRYASLLLVAALAGPGLLHGQEPAPCTIRPGDSPQAFHVVASFLNLGPDQVQALVRLLQTRQEATAPLVQAIAEREQRIRALLASGGDPAEIGALVVQVHHLRQGVAQAQAEFLIGFAGILSRDQQQRWYAVVSAVRLQPIVPAFQALSQLS